MNIPLSIVEAGKTDEYVRLQQRLEHFNEKRAEALTKALAAARNVYEALPHFKPSAYPMPTGQVIEINKATARCLIANRELEKVEVILTVVENDIKRLEEGGA